MSASTEPSAHVPDAAAPPAGERAARRALWLFAGGVLLVWALHNALLYAWEERHLDAALAEPLRLALRAVTWMLPIAVYLRRHDPRPALEALGVTTRVSSRGLVKSALIAAVYLSLIGLLLHATAQPGAALGVWEAIARRHFFYLVVHCALEELLMRGFLLGQLVRFTSSFRAQAYTAGLFALMHLPSWIFVDGMGIELLPSTIVALLLGAVLGAVARTSNNIVPATVLHIVNNLIAEVMGNG
jgi:membrane protease YdiL (CAAX protease family)